MADHPDMPSDLTACDREPIHIPGLIQPFGVLAVVRLTDFRIIQVSENTQALSGRPPVDWLDQALTDLIDGESLVRLRESLARDALHSLHPMRLSLFGQNWLAFFHRQHKLLIAEFEPVDARQLHEQGFDSEGELPFDAIYSCENNASLCQLLCREIRRITGFDRVMAYRFDEDWHGVVIAEEKNQVYPETYLNHHFPASDIPAQARQLFALNRLRMIPQVDYRPAALVPPVNPQSGRPLDMTWAMLRNVSPVHLEYLRNMGVAASLTISLMNNDRLWGMITCHHATPRLVPHEIRLRCKILGELASYAIAAQERRQYDQLAHQRQDELAQVAECLAEAETLQEGLCEARSHLLRALQADSVLFRLNGVEGALGKPIEAADRQLLQDVLLQEVMQRARGKKQLFSCRNLARLDPRLQALAADASGALLIYLEDQGDFLLALRREVIESRVWAGDPNKVIRTDPQARIHPRKSFEQWLEKVRGHSRRWTELDRQAALELKRLICERREQIHRVKVEAALKDSEAQFRATFEQAAVGVAHVGLDGRWIRVNQRLSEILGYSREELEACTFQEVTHPEDIQADLERFKQVMQGKLNTYSLEKRYIQKNGTVVWGNLTVSLIRDQQGNPRHFIAIVEDVTQRKSAEEYNRYLANHDTLTGLPNRAYFSDRLHEAIARGRREHGQFALMLLDLDRFKSVNDTLGHHVGDLLLKEVASRLLASVRETDVVSRLGGDEFAVIQSHLTTPDASERLAMKIVEELGRPYTLDGVEVHSGTSVGITVYPQDAQDPISLFKNADLALYRTKERGRHGYSFFTEDLHNEVQSRKALEEGLCHALQNKSLMLHYQPVFDLQTGRPVGTEALLRWRTPQGQLLPATNFMALAEETGLIVPLGEWALQEACRQAALWREMEFPPIRMGVNLSRKQLKNARIISLIRELLEEYRLDPGCLDIEVNEGQIVQDQEQAGSVLRGLKELGVRICADDFGAGLGSLGQLGRLPVDVVKIDRSIIQKVPHNRHDAAIASAVINLAQELNMQVVGEGIETLEQLAFLEGRGCTGGQGVIFSPPVSAGEMTHLLSSRPNILKH